MIDRRDMRTEQELIEDNKRYPEAIEFTNEKVAYFAAYFIEDLAPIYGVRGKVKLYLMGSRATNKNSPYSDFDIIGILENAEQYKDEDLNDFAESINKEGRKFGVPIDFSFKRDLIGANKELLTKTIEY